MSEKKKQMRGFAVMEPELQKKIASKGGITVSSNKEHMQEIGRKGGKSISQNREHMAKIGRIGGLTRRKTN